MSHDTLIVPLFEPILMIIISVLKILGFALV